MTESTCEANGTSSLRSILREICRRGIEARYGINPESVAESPDDRLGPILERLDHELDVIDDLNRTGCFLSAWDLSVRLRAEGTLMSPGFGSVGGSLVAYLAFITEIDPLKYDLIFERFMNPLIQPRPEECLFEFSFMEDFKHPERLSDHHRYCLDASRPLMAAVRSVQLNENPDFDINAIPLDDDATFQLINQWDTEGVFFLDGKHVLDYDNWLSVEEMLDQYRRFNVTCFEDLIALYSLVRPGPIKFLDSFIARKDKGETRPRCGSPILEPFLKDTFGQVLYQEQVIRIFHSLAGFSLAEADLARRAIGKKRVSEMDHWQARFMEGFRGKRGEDNGQAEMIWEEMCAYVGYAFNKAHAVAATLIAYRGAYLKANYRGAFEAVMASTPDC